MSKHTAGQWFVCDEKNGAFTIAQVLTNNVICHRAQWTSNREESEANARLIAAAPDMLDALIITFKAFNDPEMDCLIECKDCEHEKTCPNVIVRKAIESATGQSIDNIMKEHNRCM